MLLHQQFTITKNQEILPGHRLMAVLAPELVDLARPGQFLHIRCSASVDPLLRRPVSIHAVSREKGLLYLLYRVVGKGTALLARRLPGEELDIIGPLGNGFTLPQPGEQVAVVGGGIGTAPLFFLAQEIIQRRERNPAGPAVGAENYGGEIPVQFFLGAATKDLLPAVEQITALGVPAHTATDDGSAGFHGTVAALLEMRLEYDKFHRIYACGPTPMLRALAGIIVPRGIPAQVSLEERMGCGVGACLSCACKIKVSGADGFEYKHACTDGPVFNLGEVYYES